MIHLNEVLLTGNLVANPELRYTPEKIPVCDFRIGSTRRYTARDGEKREATTFIDVTAWNGQAEAIHRHLRKGSRVLVNGRLETDQWESKSGEKRSKHFITASRVQFDDRKPANAGAEPEGEVADEAAEPVGAQADGGDEAPS